MTEQQVSGNAFNKNPVPVLIEHSRQQITNTIVYAGHEPDWAPEHCRAEALKLAITATGTGQQTRPSEAELADIENLAVMYASYIRTGEWDG